MNTTAVPVHMRTNITGKIWSLISICPHKGLKTQPYWHDWGQCRHKDPWNPLGKCFTCLEIKIMTRSSIIWYPVPARIQNRARKLTMKHKVWPEFVLLSPTKTTARPPSTTGSTCPHIAAPSGLPWIALRCCGLLPSLRLDIASSVPRLAPFWVP